MLPASSFQRSTAPSAQNHFETLRRRLNGCASPTFLPHPKMPHWRRPVPCRRTVTRMSPAMVTPAVVSRRCRKSSPPVVRQTRTPKPKRKQPNPDASPANPRRTRSRRPANWKSSTHSVGHSVCRQAATPSRIGHIARCPFLAGQNGHSAVFGRDLVSAAEQRTHHAAEQGAGAAAAAATAVIVTAAIAGAATAGRTRRRLFVVAC